MAHVRLFVNSLNSFLSAITGGMDKAERDRANRAGVNACVTRPVLPGELRRVMDQAR